MSLVTSSIAFADSLTFVFSDVPFIRINTQSNLDNNSIAWNEYSSVYYIAGVDSNGTNVDVFDEDGKHLQQKSFPFEAKGVWYNESLAFPEAYNENSNTCVSFFVDENGLFENTDTLGRIESMQDGRGSTFTVYNSIFDVYAFTEPIAGLIIEASPYTGEINDYLSLELPENRSHMKLDQILYTASEAMPYALVNQKDNELYCFNNEGELSMKFLLPVTYFTPKYYGYANGMLWIYNDEEGEWTGHGFVIR